MKLVMVGSGYVGLVSGVCFADFGFDVTCVDVDESKIARLETGQLPIYEPGLDQLLAENVQAGRLRFSTDLAAAAANADAVFIAVGTPSRRGDGEADLSYVFEAARQVARVAKPGTVVIIKSTVVVGTCRKVKEIIAAERPDLDFSVASNPEFLREGSAIEDFMRPDRVVIGVHDKRGESILRRAYRPLYLRDSPVVVTTLENAELIKYASNAFLAMKVTFINEVADLCETVGGNVQEVARAIGLDGRIGAKFLHAGPGFGGSCFPKDTRAFAATGQRYNAPLRLIEAVISVNEDRKRRMAARILEQLGSDARGKKVAVLGIAFKPNTDDVREAPSLDIVPRLIEAGATVVAHDPEARKQAQAVLKGVVWAEDAYEAAEGADVVAVLTEWNEYRGLDLKRLAKAMRGNTLVDLRNIYRPEDLEETGLFYISVGRPSLGEPRRQQASVQAV
ncbi:UDP-glucose dehydrogenase family protein [Rhodoligotrophos defluvii]|uniref:UDP-glucose dehydrogenase family protein n=1 Tax=Rhodoligotrophos defluvii TaxID=2561934 RepID=UPI0010C9EBA6|nr:UDP-glucose/GDP-mannose dehydrogenase family protein [Rhodoligotrophos defluvii]